MTFWLTGSEELHDPRFRQAGPGACGLYTWSGQWCMGQVQWRPEHDIPSEWFVPDWWIRTWPNGARLAARLVMVGLWYRSEYRGEDGYTYAWIRPENTADAVRQRRAAERKKWDARQARKRLLNPPTPQGSYRGELPPENGVRDSRKKWERGYDQ